MRRAIGFERMRPLVGMHVRRGDKQLEAPDFALAKYVSAACEVQRTMQPLARTVFLATESPEITASALQEQRAGEARRRGERGDGRECRFNYTWTRGHQRSMTKRGQVFMMAEGALQPETEFMVSIVNCLLLAEADYFVGTHATNFGQLVAEMRVAWHDDRGEGRPYRFLDNEPDDWGLRDKISWKQMKLKYLGQQRWNPELTGEQ